MSNWGWADVCLVLSDSNSALLCNGFLPHIRNKSTHEFASYNFIYTRFYKEQDYRECVYIHVMIFIGCVFWFSFSRYKLKIHKLFGSYFSWLLLLNKNNNKLLNVLITCQLDFVSFGLARLFSYSVKWYWN